MVKPTFSLWEIIIKFFFLALGFHILATQENYFYGPDGSQWGPGCLLAHFRAKMAILDQIYSTYTRFFIRVLTWVKYGDFGFKVLFFFSFERYLIFKVG